jgi:DNA-binding HxlR family transcriptional regulator
MRLPERLKLSRILPRYSYLLAGLVPDAKVKIYPDSAHGQGHQGFAAEVAFFGSPRFRRCQELNVRGLRSIMEPTMLGGVERKSFADMHCSVAQCLDVVGEWWSMLIVRDTFLGVSRFDDFQERLGISRNILNQRLQGLVEAGILVKLPYSEHPPRYDYRLTDKGRDLWPVLTAMRQWGDKHAAPQGPPLQVVHKACGEIAEAVFTCSVCGEPMGLRDVRAISGPGAVEQLVDVVRPAS